MNATAMTEKNKSAPAVPAVCGLRDLDGVLPSIGLISARARTCSLLLVWQMRRQCPSVRMHLWLIEIGSRKCHFKPTMRV